MNLNFYNLTWDIQSKIFSLLSKKELISTLPLVCGKFNVLLINEVYWNNLRVKRQTVQLFLSLPIKYTNQIAMQHLKLEQFEDFQNFEQFSPYQQRVLILKFLDRKIQEHSNPEHTFPLSLTCSKTQQIWIESTNNLSAEVRESPTHFSKDKAVEISNSICPGSNLLLAEDELEFMKHVLNKNRLIFQSPMPNVLDQYQKAVFELPLKLKHLGNTEMGNTDGIGGVLQALLCMDCVREQFNHGSLEINDEAEFEDLKKNIAVQQEILQFIPELGENDMLSREELVSFLLKEPSLLRLKQAIFNSGKLPMERPEDPINAPQLMEFFIDTFLPNCQLELERHTTTEYFPAYEFFRRERVSLLPINLPKQSKYQSLEMLIKSSLDKVQYFESERLFDPMEGVVINQEQAALHPLNSAQKVSDYSERLRFKNFPPILTLCLNRITFDPIERKHTINDSPIILPRDGIIDFSRYSDDSTENIQILYKIKSYITPHFIGFSLSGERYGSYVEIDGKYYYCDESNQEISREQFLENENPYLIVLERISK